MEKTTFRFDEQQQPPVPTDAPPIKVPTASGGTVDASCNQTITITCLQQLYNAVGFVPSANSGNKVAVTGYLDQFANLADLQLFFADERPDAVNSSFTLIEINGECQQLALHSYSHLDTGGQNNQSVSEAGAEADLGEAGTVPVIV